MTRFTIDPSRSRVWIEARSSLHPIHSETTGPEGWFEGEFDEAGRLDPSSATHGQLDLAVDLLRSGNPLYDREMRRRVDARRHPTISGVLTGLSPSGDHRYEATGDVTFRGVTRSFVGELSIDRLDEGAVSIEGKHVFDVRDFGMDPPRILALRVYPDVSVRVALVVIGPAGVD